MAHLSSPWVSTMTECGDLLPPPCRSFWCLSRKGGVGGGGSPCCLACWICSTYDSSSLRVSAHLDCA
eukprot:322622-Pleurochrysis_carterae.AAC.1